MSFHMKLHPSFTGFIMFFFKRDVKIFLLIVGYILELVGSGGRDQHGDKESGSLARRHGGFHPHRIHMTSTRAHRTTRFSMEPLHCYGASQATEGRSSVSHRMPGGATRAESTEGLPPRRRRAPAPHPPRNPAAAVTLRESYAQ